MERKIRADRRYPLGDYRYVTLEDEISGVPAELMMKPEVVGKLRYLQLVSFEIAYRKYQQLILDVPYNKGKMDLEAAIAKLEEIRHDEFEKLAEVLNGHLSHNVEA
jgi:hypothetical protein